jgi:flagellar biosynthesis/type III secretory pathway chaperone
MNSTANLIDDLNEHQTLCQQLLAIVQSEAETLHRGDNPSLFALCQLRKNLLPRLDQSLECLRRDRIEWKKRTFEERAGDSEIRRLFRRNQELCLKIMVLDRENEQRLLRRGVVPAPASLPSGQQRAHFVAELYRRQNRTGAAV